MSSSRTAIESAPRKLSTHQKAVLIQVLLAFPEQQVGICYSPNAPDALAYAQDFMTIFRAIGWTVNEAEWNDLVADRSIGLAIIVRRLAELPPSAQALRDSLRIYRIEVETICDSGRNIASGSFVLAIG